MIATAASPYPPPQRPPGHELWRQPDPRSRPTFDAPPLSSYRQRRIRVKEAT